MKYVDFDEKLNENLQVRRFQLPGGIPAWMRQQP